MPNVKNTLFFDTGVKTFRINNDQDCTISFNPADSNFFDRLTTAANNIANLTERTEDQLQDIQKLETKCRAEINKIFGEDVCTRIFGETSVCALGSNGYPVAYNFLSAIKDQCETDVKERTAKLKKNTEKYTSGYDDEDVQPAANA